MNIFCPKLGEQFSILREHFFMWTFFWWTFFVHLFVNITSSWVEKCKCSPNRWMSRIRWMFTYMWTTVHITTKSQTLIIFYGRKNFMIGLNWISIFFGFIGLDWIGYPIWLYSFDWIGYPYFLFFRLDPIGEPVIHPIQYPK